MWAIILSNTTHVSLNTCINTIHVSSNTCIEQYMYMSHQNKSYQQSLEKRKISGEHERQY